MHAQSEGKSEIEIQTIIAALRSYVNAIGDDWGSASSGFARGRIDSTSTESDASATHAPSDKADAASSLVRAA